MRGSPHVSPPLMRGSPYVSPPLMRGSPILIYNHSFLTDQLNVKSPYAEQLDRSRANERVWVELLLGLPPHSLTADVGASPGSARTIAFDCITHALHWASGGRHTPPSPQVTLPSPPPSPTFPKTLGEAAHIQVLVTGSLHLVGGVMGLLGADVDSL